MIEAIRLGDQVDDFERLFDGHEFSKLVITMPTATRRGRIDIRHRLAFDPSDLQEAGAAFRRLACAAMRMAIVLGAERGGYRKRRRAAAS